MQIYGLSASGLPNRLVQTVCVLSKFELLGQFKPTYKHLSFIGWVLAVLLNRFRVAFISCLQVGVEMHGNIPDQEAALLCNMQAVVVLNVDKPVLLQIC